MSFGKLNHCAFQSEEAILKLIAQKPVDGESDNTANNNYNKSLVDLAECFNKTGHCSYNKDQMNTFVVKLFSAQYMPGVCTIDRKQRYSYYEPCSMVSSAIDIIARISYENCDSALFDTFMQKLDASDPNKIWDVVESPYSHMDSSYLCPGKENPEAGTAVILIHFLLGEKTADKFMEYLKFKCEKVD